LFCLLYALATNYSCTSYFVFHFYLFFLNKFQLFNFFSKKQTYLKIIKITKIEKNLKNEKMFSSNLLCLSGRSHRVTLF